MMWECVGPGEIKSLDGRWTLHMLTPGGWSVQGPVNGAALEGVGSTPAQALLHLAQNNRAFAGLLAHLADEAERLAQDGMTINPIRGGN